MLACTLCEARLIQISWREEVRLSIRIAAISKTTKTAALQITLYGLFPPAIGYLIRKG